MALAAAAEIEAAVLVKPLKVPLVPLGRLVQFAQEAATPGRFAADLPAGFRERVAFYTTAMKDEANHASIAGEMAYLRAQADKAPASTPSQQLRDLRLSHWRKYLRTRDVIKTCNSVIEVEVAHLTGTAHMLAVQALNDLFPIGDTAEKDAAIAATPVAQ